MKKIVAGLCLSFLLVPSAQAQIIEGLNGKQDSIAKTIHDYSKYRIVYAYRHVEDAQHPTQVKKSLSLLQIGDKWNGFQDYRAYQEDSIVDDGAKRGLSIMEVYNKRKSLNKAVDNNEKLLFDKQKAQLSAYQPIGFKDNYTYIEPIPTMQWQLEPGDSTILGYPCHAAQTTFRGRQYTAWYTDDINLPYGPYKFGGLPGLILSIKDHKGEIAFQAVGIEQTRFCDPIYVDKETKWQKSKREKLLKIDQNFHASPSSFLRGEVEVEGMTLEEAFPAQPYNPIELE